MRSSSMSTIIRTLLAFRGKRESHKSLFRPTNFTHAGMLAIGNMARTEGEDAKRSKTQELSSGGNPANGVGHVGIAVAIILRACAAARVCRYPASMSCSCFS